MNLRLARTRPRPRVEPLADGAVIHFDRGYGFSESVRLGPNQWHWLIIHADGTTTDLGIVPNLLTNTGRDLWDEHFGQRPIKEGALTASSATSATPAGGGMTVDAYKGWRIYCPVTGLTTAPVYGNIGSNSATVFTIDQWWNAADGAGATPAATNGYMAVPSSTPRFMALTENAAAAAATDTALTGELTTGGCNRQLATFAHTAGTSTYTMSKTFAVSATFPDIRKGALFTASNVTAAGIMTFEAALNAAASVISGDSLAVTSTVTTTG